MHQIQLLRKYELSLRGVRGQHLLVDENIQRKLVSCVNPNAGETIIEIGPGLGAITELLLDAGAHVIAVEQDGRFVEILKGELSRDFKNLAIIHADILKTEFKRLVRGKPKAKVVGNIPYYITAPILEYLIKHRSTIDSAYLTVQREVADRIFAQPGTKAYGRLTLFVRIYAQPRRYFEISRNCFSPKPRVNSTAIELVFRSALPESIDEDLLLEIIRVGFGKRRKNILNALSGGFSAEREGISFGNAAFSKDEIKSCLLDCGIKTTARAEELMLKDFIRLAERFKEKIAFRRVHPTSDG